MVLDSRGHYTALELEDATEFRNRNPISAQDPAHTPSYASLRCLFFTCLISLVISTLNLAASGLYGASPLALIRQPKPEYASVYIGLERLNVSQRLLDMPPIPNYPLLLSSVNRARPAEVDRNGTVFDLEPQRSMIMQFRVHDFGLERCTLNVTLPSPDELKGKSYTLAGSTDEVKVWRLSDAELRPRILSWKTRPSRVAEMGTLDFREGESSQIPWFDCLSGSLQTFEFACTSADCSIRFKQDRAPPWSGVMMRQKHE